MKKLTLIVFFITISIRLLSQELIPVNDRYYRLNPILAPFYHGVASGDALTDKVIIWTRVTPSLDSIILDDISVLWEMATDTTFTNIVKTGTFITDYFRDYTVKVDVLGLQPGIWYYYRFKAFNKYSIIGRTRTAPIGDVDSIRFAFVTGSNYNAGYFNAYKRIGARNDVDAVLHLGDYIYEYENNGYGSNDERSLEPRGEILNIHDYRIRYSHYRLDQDLMFAHQQYPWYVIWDDHEVANDTWKEGAENHSPDSEGSFVQRKNAALEAYYEWMPIREIDINNKEKIYRQITYGNLLDLNFLESRLIARDDQSIDRDDPNKKLLGDEQFDWLFDKLDNSSAIWKIIAQQVMITPVEIPGYGPFSSDDWNGYRVERKKLLSHVKANDTNVVFLTGDIHTSWACDVYIDKDDYYPSGDGSVLPEFVTPSITSASFPFEEDFGVTAPIIKTANNNVKYVDIIKKGYAIADINKLRTQTDWYYVDKIDKPSDNEEYGAGYYVNNGDRFVKESAERAERKGPLPIQAPAPYVEFNVGINQPIISNTQNTVLLGTYPNPVDKRLVMQYFVYKPQQIKANISDITGKSVLEFNLGQTTSGIKYTSINTESLKSGVYILTLISEDNQLQKIKIVKN